MIDLDPRPLPLLTQDLAGTGGTSKVVPEDFAVEEIPAYEPCGEGEHLYVLVEKRGLSTVEASRLLAQAAGVQERDVGYAGQKDRHAVTRQWMSFPTKLNAIASPDERITLVAQSRHRNRLRVGHNRGNKFTLVLRGVRPGAEEAARAVLDVLAHRGLPNFYGAQRFGRHGDNAALGAALLGLGEHAQADRAKRDRHLKRLALSALQSELFNRWLVERLADGLWERVIAGDVLRKRASGGVFTSTDAAADQPRVDATELDLTGPMPGSKEHPVAAAEARAREERVLEQAGVPREALARGGADCEGARRAARVPVTATNVRGIDAETLEISFALPSGSYATRVLAEVTKTDVALPSEE